MTTLRFSGFAFRDPNGRIEDFRKVNVTMVTTDGFSIGYRILRMNEGGIAEIGLASSGTLYRYTVDGVSMTSGTPIAFNITWKGQTTTVLGADGVDGETVFFRIGGAELPTFTTLRAFRNFVDTAEVTRPSGTFGPGVPIKLASLAALVSRTEDDRIVMTNADPAAVKITPGKGNDSITGNSGDNDFDLGSGNDTGNGGLGNDRMMGKSGNDALNGGSGNDTLDGGSGNDVLRGDAGNDSLTASLGDDTVHGGGGNDYVSGSLGNDVINGDGGNDDLNGIDGNDTISGGDGGDTLTGGIGNDSLKGGVGDDMLFGQDGNDSLEGDIGNDILAGGAGDDVLVGGDGNDRLRDNRDETGEGEDSIYGGNGDDTAEGGVDNDRLDGGAGNDSLNGGAGEDILIGNIGNDTLTGGDGSDFFDFSNFTGTINGRIRDFQQGIDSIGLEETAAEIQELDIVQSGANVRITLGTSFTLIVDNTTVQAVTDALEWY